MISNLIHISDLHIRLYKRHDEYSAAFTTLIHDLKQWKKHYSSDTVIVLTGDIFHSKNELSPESISLAHTILSQLAEIYPTFVIAGNHDCTLSNLDRLDALTPIVRDIPNLTYLRNSEVHSSPLGIHFAVFSVLDKDRSHWPTAAMCPDNFPKIALYHGPVLNSTTDTGYIITGDSTVGIDLFEDFDFVLLGDIHKWQILSDSYPLIAYAGSMIQQNHGELYGTHGWLHWDLTKKTCEFHELKNAYGYVTLNVAPGNFPDIDTFEFPEISRMRIIATDVSAAEVKDYVASIHQSGRTKIIDLATTYQTSVQTVNNLQTSKYIANIHDVTCQNDLMKKYLSEKYSTLNTLPFDEIVALNAEVNLAIEKDTLPQNIQWVPIRLTFDNLFSYGLQNQIDFTKLKGLYGLFSPNATGKTSSFDALCFALYDKTPRAFKGNHIMNTSENEFNCELIFSVNGEEYRIVRTGRRKANGDVRVDVGFMKNSGMGWESLNGTDRKSTNAIIRSYVGEYEDFVLTNLSVQNDNSLFIEKGNTDRKDSLSQFLGLMLFEKLYDVALLKSKDITSQIKQYKGTDWQSYISELLSTIAKEEAQIVVGNEELQSLDAKREEYSVAINELNRNVVPLSVTSLGVQQLQTKIKDEETALLSSTRLIAEYQEAKDILIAELSVIKENVSVVENASSDEVLAGYTTASNRLAALRQELEGIRSEKAHLTTISDLLRTHEYDPNCSYCVNNKLVKNAQAAILEIRSLTQTSHEILAEMIEVEQKKKKLHDAVQELNRIQKHQSSIDRMSVLLGEQHLLHTKSENTIFNLRRELDDVLKNIALIVENDRLMKSIKDLTDQQTMAGVLQQTRRTEMETLQGNLLLAREQIRQAKSNLSELVELEGQYKIYQYYLDCVGTNGLPYYIVTQVIPTIEHEINEILKDIVDFQLVLETDGKNINASIAYSDIKRWPIELASGMEKFIMSLVIRIILTSFSSLPRANFLILDEGLGVLDSDNLASVFKLFNVLKTQYDFIVLISHLESVRDVADHLIEIYRDPHGYSHIKI